VRNAQKSVTLVTTSKGILRKVEALRPELERLKKRGVRIRVVAPATKESLQSLKEISKIAEVRNANKLDARFCIVDGKELMFMVLHDDDIHPTYDVGVWVSTPYFAGALETLFEQHWNTLSDPTKNSSVANGGK
jgi:phosphatidylserine/phosphatidylglycerophosphate/cardiolipin synthase-like enzyme